MSENVENAQQPGLSDEVMELQGSFPNDAALQDVIGRLELAGFDHAALSLPDPNAPVDTPDSAQPATDHVDQSQLRTMASGMAGTTAGFIAAGVVAATGGLAAPVVAAIGAASATGTVIATSGIAGAKDTSEAKARDEMGAAGKLILAVRINSPEERDKAIQLFQECGVTAITAVEDAEQAKTRGTNATSWTG